MKESDIRKELHKYVNEADIETLKFFKEAIAHYKTNKQMEAEELQPPLRPYTEDELIARILESEENLKNGKYYTEEEMNSFIDQLNEGI